MLHLLEEWKKRREVRALAVGLLGELERNLESYYVLSQIGRLRFFPMTCLQEFQAQMPFPLDEKVLDYAKIVDEYNKCLKDFKTYEDWYTSELNNKTRDHARELHAKREFAFEKIKGLEQVIKPAFLSFEQKLFDLKYIKQKGEKYR